MSRRRRGAASLIIAALALVLTPAACVASNPGGQGMDEYEQVRIAVTAADPAVVAIQEVSSRVNGLGRAMTASLVIDHGPRLSADELRGIAAAIWTSSPFRPNAIRIVAARPGGDAIDLTAAAEALMPGRWAPFGVGGVTLIGMTEAFGDRGMGDRSFGDRDRDEAW